MRTGTRIRTLIKGFGDLYSTIELFPYTPWPPKGGICLPRDLFLFNQQST